MTIATKKITPCLWFDGEAEEAANFYVSVFKNGKINGVMHYKREGHEIHKKKTGSVMAVEFEIDGQPFLALNGGPQYTFSEAISFQIPCESQKEVDYFWSKLSEGGSEGPCGWLKDKFGLSWQVVPTVLPKMLTSGDAEKSERVTKAFMQMKKFDIAALERAYNGAN